MSTSRTRHPSTQLTRLNIHIRERRVVSPPAVPGWVASELVSLAAVLTHQYPHLLLPEEPGEQRRDRQTHF